MLGEVFLKWYRSVVYCNMQMLMNMLWNSSFFSIFFSFSFICRTDHNNCNDNKIYAELKSVAISVPHAFWGRGRGSSTPNISSWTTVTGRRQRQRHADMQSRDRPTAWHHCGESGTKKEECCRRADRSPWRRATAGSSPHPGLSAAVPSKLRWHQYVWSGVFCRETPRLPVERVGKSSTRRWFCEQQPFIDWFATPKSMIPISIMLTKENLFVSGDGICQEKKNICERGGSNFIFGDIQNYI